MTVQVSAHTHKLLRGLAAATGEPLQKALERAVEYYRRERFYAELDAAYARLRADPVAWAEGAGRAGGDGGNAGRRAR